MRYRKLDANGDYVLGLGAQNFLVNSPQCVAQAVLTALNLWLGEWFLNLLSGVAWMTQVVGFNPKELYDSVVQDCINNVQGVQSIVSYNSTLSPLRVLTITVDILTIYSAEVIGVTTTIDLGGFGIGPFGGRPFSS